MSQFTRLGWVLCLSLSLGAPVFAASAPQTQKTASVDGAHATLGAKADAASTDSTTTNSLMSFLKGLVKILADSWDDPNNRLNVAVQNTPAVTIPQSNVTVDADTGAGTQTLTLFGIALPGSGGAVIGGTSANPLSIVFPSAQPVMQSGTWNIDSVSTLPSISLNQAGTANDVDATIANWPTTVGAALSVRCVNTTGSAFVDCGGGAGGGGGVSAVDKEAFVASTSPGTPIMGARDDASASACAEDEKCIARMTQARGVHANLRNDSGTEIGTSGTPLRIDPTGTTTQPMSAASLPLPAGAATEATLASMLTALQLIDNIVSGSGANISQINGVTPLMGAGNTGTGSHRTTEATDSQLSAGVGATGDAAATAGSTGSLNAKARYLTQVLSDLVAATALEDVASSGGERLTKMGCRRQDTAAISSGTDGDWSTVDCKAGGLSVHITGTDVGGTSTDDDGTVADGGTAKTEVLTLTYAWNSDSGVTDWTRLSHQPADFDSGGGTENLSLFGIALPGSGGPVIGGTSSNPFSVVFPSAQAVTGSGNFSVVGTKSHNGGAPGSTNLGVLPCVATASAPSFTEGNQVGCSTDLSGNVRITGAGGGGTSSNFGSAVPSAGTAAGFSDGANMQLARLFDLDSGGGTQYGLGVNLRKIASGGSVEAGTASDPLRTDPTGGTTQPVSAASLPLPAGAATETTLASMLTAVQLIDNMISGSGANISQINGVTPLMGAGNTGTGSHRTTEATDSQLSAGVGATGDAAATAGSTGSLNAKARLMTSLLDTISTNLASLLTSSQLIDNDQTGASIHHRVSTGSSEDEHQVKGSAGRLLSINVTNTNAAARYLRCADQVAASTTPGTTAVWYGMAIPGATTGAGFTANFGPKGIAFSTGLTCWLVTGAPETDVAEVAANEINVNYTYE